MSQIEKVPIGEIPGNLVEEVIAGQDEQEIVLETGLVGPDRQNIGLRIERSVFERMASKFKELGLEPQKLENKKIVFMAAGAVAAVTAGAGVARLIRDKREEKRTEAGEIYQEVDRIKRGEMTVFDTLSMTDEAVLEKLNLTFKKKEEFGVIYESYYPHIYSFIKMRADIIDEDAADLAEYVFIRAMGKFHEFVPRQDLNNPVLSWLYRIASNLILNYFRDKARRREESIEDIEERSGRAVFRSRQTSPEEAAELSDRMEELGRAFKKLIPSYQLVLALQSDDLLTDEDIAFILDTTVGAVKSQTLRARRKLGEMMGRMRKN